MAKYDLVVIGSGPAGRRGAVQAAKLGHSVLVVEKGRRVGGVSVHTGTIPSKTMRETVLNLTGWRERGFYGRAYRVKKDLDVKDIMLRMHKTLDHEVNVLEHQFARNGVRTLQGAAHFIDAHRIEVQMADDESKTIEGERFLIAVGSRPHRPENVPFDGVCVFDSDDILELPRLPRSLTVVGAGVIGIEYATIFSALDVSVCLIESRYSMLDFVDRELMAEFTHELRDRGVAIRLGAKVDHIEINDGRPMVVLEGGRQMRSDMLLYAAGRMGDTEPLNLAACGLATDDRGRLAVDAKTYQTAVPHIYAAV
jgi:NAD(P) transhydrogenase